MHRSILSLFLVCACWLGLILPAQARADTALIWPDMTGEYLSGEEGQLPADFAAISSANPDIQAHMVLILFDREQQDMLDEWAQAADQLPADIGLMEIALIGKVGGIARFFIKNGMKDMIEPASRHAGMMPFFGDVEAVKSALEITDISAINAFLVASDGTVIWRDKGAYKGQYKTLPNRP